MYSATASPRKNSFCKSSLRLEVLEMRLAPNNMLSIGDAM